MKRNEEWIDIEKCREALGDNDITEPELLSVREELYAWASIIISGFNKSAERAAGQHAPMTKSQGEQNDN